MKTQIKDLSLLPALIAGLGLMLAGRVTAQPLTFTVLHTFTGPSGYLGSYGTNSDGLFPDSRLILSGNTLYGTAGYGGTNGNGTVFALNTDGMGFTTLYSFSASSTNSSGEYTNSDGIDPQRGLILSGNTLYGTATVGGTNGSGTVFAVNTDGTGFKTLYSFSGADPGTNSDGAGPQGELILSGNTLYGTAHGGGNSDNGTVFAVNTDGTGFTNLHSFTTLNNYTNSDGIGPEAGLIRSGSILYGTAGGGGSSGGGTVFALNTDGTGFTNLHSFAAFDPYTNQNSDGADPKAALTISGTTLYGTALVGGSLGYGTVFSIGTDGSGFKILHSFTGDLDIGANPSGSLILSGKTLFGTAGRGGFADHGTLFAVNINNGFYASRLHVFNATSNGIYPQAGLVLSGNTLYGTANHTVFSLSGPQPQLTISSSCPNVILSWPTSVAGFDYSGYTLQQNSDLTTTNWTDVPTPPVLNLTNLQNQVAVSPTNSNSFYRLKH